MGGFMDILTNIKKLLQFYNAYQSPSKKIIQYGSLLSIELALVSLGLLLLYLNSPSSYYYEASYLTAKTSISIFIELVLSAFVFDFVFQTNT